MTGGEDNTVDARHAGAVLELARKLFGYGQFDRVLSLLNLANWISPSRPETTLRILALCRTGRYDEALQLCLQHPAGVERGILAEVHWGTGDTERGDMDFRAAVAADQETMTARPNGRR